MRFDFSSFGSNKIGSKKIVDDTFIAAKE